MTSPTALAPTAYSVFEFTGSESALDDRFTEARTIYLGFIVVTAVSAASVWCRAHPSWASSS